MLTIAGAVDLGARGRSAEADQEWQRGIDLLRGYERVDWLLHVTAWLVAASAADDGWGRPVDWMQDAVRWFSTHGYQPLAAAARRFLLGQGAPAPRRGRGESTVPPSLAARGVTSREVDVLRLLDQRLTNAEIASRLYLSHRTVEKHVASLLRRTGSASRSDLAALATSLNHVQGADPAQLG
jgi:DNA-binding CsgD family transcriptional regulator